MRAALFVAVVVATPYVSHALSCFCGHQPCTDMTCCDSGWLSSDACGCCPTCARAEGVSCGGPWGVSGACAAGLSCYKSCGCQTINRKTCVFPFEYEGQVYHECTRVNSENKQPWCATAVDDSGKVIPGYWADCAGGCPGSDYPCDLFNIDGVCVNAEFRADIENDRENRLDPVSKEPNFQFIDGVSANHSRTVPRCQDVETTIEGNPPIHVKEGDEKGDLGECHCDLTTSRFHSFSEPCRSANGRFSKFDQGWCFLELIADPSTPTKNCYKDVKWHASAGRFFSRDACTHLRLNEADQTSAAPVPESSTIPAPDYIPVYDLDDLDDEAGEVGEEGRVDVPEGTDTFVLN